MSDDTIELNTGSPVKHITFAVIVLALILPAVYRCYRIFRADRIAMTDQTFAGYTRALQCDPSNASLWWRRGRTSQYSIQNPESISQAASDYKRALALNPRIGQAWLALADCYEQMGKYNEAEKALAQACAVQAYSPTTHWQAGNYYLRRGNFPKMYENFKTAIEYDPAKLTLALNLSYDADPDHTRILRDLMPDSMQDWLVCLNFLVKKGDLTLARAAWKRCLRSSVPRNFRFSVSAPFAYIDALLSVSLVPEALQVWSETLVKAETGLKEIRYPAAFQSPEKRLNLVWNGSFEYAMLHGGFDWRYPDSPNFDAQIVRNNCVDGFRCLQLDFDRSNASAEFLNQIVPIPEPGAYTLELYLRTDRLISARAYFIEVDGFPDSSGVAARIPIPAESTSWEKLTVPVIVKPNTCAVSLAIGPDPSSQADKQLSGTLWLDGVAIYRSVESSK